MTVDLAIKGGTVVRPAGQIRAHVYVDGGRFVHVGEENRSAHQTVDATGLSILPGMVDTHVHLMDPGPSDREDFPTGTSAAATRGVTTVVEHTHAHPIRTVADLEEKVGYLEGRSNVDFGLAAHIWPDQIDRLASLWQAGVTFFKIFTCTTHGVPGLDAAALRAALDSIGGFGGNCLIHCEDERLTAEAERMLKEVGRTDNRLLIEWRNRPAEEVAVATAGLLAAHSGARTTIAHVSTPTVARIVEWIRRSGADLVAETCPQYLALDEDEVTDAGPFRKFTPPARIRTEAEREAMWQLLRDGVFSHISTDHAPSTREQKQAGDIWEAPFGLPGLDTTLGFLLDAAGRGVISLEHVTRLYAEAPARRYGLYPRKGHIRVGADADLVLVDKSAVWKVRNEDIISKAGWTPYHGRTFLGRVTATYLRGELVAEEGRALDARTGLFLAGPGSGR